MQESFRIGGDCLFICSCSFWVCFFPPRRSLWAHWVSSRLTVSLIGSKKAVRENSQTASLCWHYLSSRAVASQVLSAQVSLTAVFGMGTGGPSPQSTPTISISTDFSVKIPSYYSTLLTSCQETFGDPYRIRTDVKGVRGLCLNHLTNGPFRCSYPLSAHQ